MSGQHRLSCAVPSIDLSEERSLTTHARLQHRVHDSHTCDESEQRQSLGQLGQSNILPHSCVLPTTSLWRRRVFLCEVMAAIQLNHLPIVGDL